MNTIAIDCGASFLKSALFVEGKIVKRLESASPKVRGDESILEIIQINELVDRVRATIIELACNEKKINLCISNEMHGFILANQDGTPYTDYISWQKEYGNFCIEGQSAYEELKAEEISGEILNTGMPLRAGLPSCNLLYMEKMQYLSKKGLHFYTLGDYIIRCLSGREPICHPTNAAATGLYDVIKGEWNVRIINFITSQYIVFPYVGEDTISFKLDDIEVVVYPALGDQQAALLGAGFLESADISYNIGTGSQVSILVDSPECTNSYQIRPYFNGLYLKTIPHIPSGRALNVYIRFFKDILYKFGNNVNNDMIWKVIIDSLSEHRTTTVKCDLSFFENAITSRTTGAIDNIMEYDLTFSSLTHAIFDCMAKNYITATNRLLSDYCNVNRVIFSGGIARKIEYLRKKILASFKEDTRVIVAENETLIGLYRYVEMGE